MKTVNNPHEVFQRTGKLVTEATRMHTKLQQEISNCQNEHQKRTLLECWSLARNDEERQQVLAGWRDVRTTESPRMLDKLKNWLKSER